MLEDLKRVSSKRLPGLSELERQTSLNMLAEAGAGGGAETSVTRNNDEKPFGALPVTDGTINIHEQQEQGDEASHMSYIYGDEDSQHHKLPDYSISHRTPKLVPAANDNFEPKMPRLEEEDGGDDAMDTDEDFDAEDDEEAVEIDGLKGNTKGGAAGMDTLSITVFPSGAPAMQTVASHSPVGDDEVVSHI